MRRRTFITLLGGAAAAWPLAVRAQQSKSIPRIGVLWHAGNEQQEAIFLGALRKGLNELGYVEGKNIELVNRFADEHYDRFDGLAAELVKANVDVIVGSISSAAIAAKRQTASIPIIFIASGDPIGMGLVDTLARPGGNVTGTSNLVVDIASKNLELLKDCFSNLSAVGILANSNTNAAFFRSYISAVQAAAEIFHVSVHVVEVRSPNEFERGFSEMGNAHVVDAVLLMPDGMFNNEKKRIADLALAHKLPVIAWSAELTEAGALWSYGANVVDLFRHTGVYIDKVLKGTKPADIPVEQPVLFDFAVNLRTAKALGLSIPATVLARADKVIE
jgi:putative tryptophan/tyrosine transport system substrate-binding protein